MPYTDTYYDDFDGRNLEVFHAMVDSKALIDERGLTVKFLIGEDESAINRDSYSSIKKVVDPESYTMNAYPINYSPERKTIEKAGLTGDFDVMITVAFYDWYLLGVKSIEDVDIIRTKVFISGDQEYRIKDKGKSSQYGNIYLFWNFGLVRI